MDLLFHNRSLVLLSGKLQKAYVDSFLVDKIDTMEHKKYFHL